MAAVEDKNENKHFFVNHTNQPSNELNIPDILTNKSQTSQNVNNSNSLNSLNLLSLPFNLFLTTSDNTKIKVNISREDDNINENDVKVDFESDSPANNALKDMNSMKSSTHTRSKSASNFTVGDLVMLSKNRQGLIRYKGELENDAGKWFGIELIGGSRGFHDGLFQGVRYFRCTKQQGLFVKKSQIVRRMDANDDYKNIDGGYTAYPTTPRTPRTPKKVEKKPGPREIGKIKGWKPSREIYKSEEELQAAKRRNAYKQSKKRRSSLTDIHAKISNLKPKKLGPRDIGRVKVKHTDWKPIKGYKETVKKMGQEKAFLQPSTFNSKTQMRKRHNSAALLQKKPGPREIGKNKAFKGIKFARRLSKGKLKRHKNKGKKQKKDNSKNKKSNNLKSLFLMSAPRGRARSMTPTPSSQGLTFSDAADALEAQNKKTKKNSRKDKKKRSKKNSKEKMDRLPPSTSRSRSKSQNNRKKRKSAMVTSKSKKKRSSNSKSTSKNNKNYGLLVDTDIQGRDGRSRSLAVDKNQGFRTLGRTQSTDLAVDYDDDDLDDDHMRNPPITHSHSFHIRLDTPTSQSVDTISIVTPKSIILPSETLESIGGASPSETDDEHDHESQLLLQEVAVQRKSLSQQLAALRSATNSFDAQFEDTINSTKDEQLQFKMQNDQMLKKIDTETGKMKNKKIQLELWQNDDDGNDTNYMD